MRFLFILLLFIALCSIRFLLNIFLPPFALPLSLLLQRHRSFDRNRCYEMQKKCSLHCFKIAPTQANTPAKTDNRKIEWTISASIFFFLFALFLCSHFSLLIMLLMKNLRASKRTSERVSLKLKQKLNERNWKTKQKKFTIKCTRMVSSLLWSFRIHCSKIFIYILSCVFILLVCERVPFSFLATRFHLLLFHIFFTPFLFILCAADVVIRRIGKKAMAKKKSSSVTK